MGLDLRAVVPVNSLVTGCADVPEGRRLCVVRCLLARPVGTETEWFDVLNVPGRVRTPRVDRAIRRRTACLSEPRPPGSRLGDGPQAPPMRSASLRLPCQPWSDTSADGASSRLATRMLSISVFPLPHLHPGSSTSESLAVVRTRRDTLPLQHRGSRTRL